MHIRLLAITDFMELFEQLVIEGRLYVAQAPLYRVTAANKKPMYFKTSKELNDFFSDESEKNFSYFDGGKEVTKDKAKKAMFNECRSYCESVERVANKYSVTPHVFEMTFLKCFDTEDFSFDFNKKKVNVDLNDNGQITITGFHRDEDSGEENFVAIINEDAETFFEDLNSLYPAYCRMALEIDIHHKSEPIDRNSMYSKINIINERLSKIYTVLRFKGLGEANADELWDTTLNPETRELVQITIEDVEDAKNTITNFMSSNRVDFRKEFLLNMFDVVDKEALSY